MADLADAPADASIGADAPADADPSIGADAPADGGRRAGPVRNGVLTIPNGLSALRLLGVPLFLWLLLGPHADWWALGVLAVSGLTDWADGALARRLGQQSEFGALLDPLADRLYILATLAGLVLRHILPLWLAVVLVARDAILAGSLVVLRRHGYAPPAVHYLGKAATFCLLYAFPLLLWGAHTGTAAEIARPIAWAFTIWGGGLYLWAGAVYLAQAAGLVRAARAGAAGRRPRGR